MYDDDITLDTRLPRRFRYVTALLCLALILITLAPISHRPSLTDDPQFDRFIALSLVGAFLTAATPHRLIAAVGLAISIVILEAGQHFIPGRHANAADVVFKIAGALTGISVVWLLQRSLRLRSIQTGVSWAAIAIGAGAIAVMSLAAWYVISPGRALQGLRHALVSQRNHTLLAQNSFSYQPVPELNDPAVRRIIIGEPDAALTTDLWGQNASNFSMTLRTPNRKAVLLVLRFRRVGLRWLLVSIATPDSVTVGK